MLWSWNYGRKIYIPGFTKNRNIMNCVKQLCNTNERIFPFSVNPFPENNKQTICATTYYDYTHGKTEFQLRNQIGPIPQEQLVDYIAATFTSNGKLDMWYYRPNLGKKKRKIYLNSPKINWQIIERKLLIFCLNDI